MLFYNTNFFKKDLTQDINAGAENSYIYIIMLRFKNDIVQADDCQVSVLHLLVPNCKYTFGMSGRLFSATTGIGLAHSYITDIEVVAKISVNKEFNCPSNHSKSRILPCLLKNLALKCNIDPDSSQLFQLNLWPKEFLKKVLVVCSSGFSPPLQNKYRVSWGLVIRGIFQVNEVSDSMQTDYAVNKAHILIFISHIILWVISHEYLYSYIDKSSSAAGRFRRRLGNASTCPYVRFDI